MKRRDFIKQAGTGSLAVGAAGLLAACGRGTPAPQAEAKDQQQTLRMEDGYDLAEKLPGPRHQR